MTTKKQAVILDRNAILAAADLKPVREDVPEWGGAVFLRPLTMAEKEDYEAALTRWVSALKVQAAEIADMPVPESFRVKLIGYALCDETGARLFDDDHLAELSARSSTVVERLYDRVGVISGLDAGAEAAAEKK